MAVSKDDNQYAKDGYESATATPEDEPEKAHDNEIPQAAELDYETIIEDPDFVFLVFVHDAIEGQREGEP